MFPHSFAKFIPGTVRPKLEQVFFDNCDSGYALLAAMRRQGFTVECVRSVGLPAHAPDPQVLNWAYRNRWLLVSADNDFPALDRDGSPHAGIVKLAQNVRSDFAAEAAARIAIAIRKHVWWESSRKRTQTREKPAPKRTSPPHSAQRNAFPEDLHLRSSQFRFQSGPFEILVDGDFQSLAIVHHLQPRYYAIYYRSPEGVSNRDSTVYAVPQSDFLACVVADGLTRADAPVVVPLLSQGLDHVRGLPRYLSDHSNRKGA